MLLGLRTAIYIVDDIEDGIAWYSQALDMEPYFHEPYYAGFNVGGYELGLIPAEEEVQPGAGGTIVYWGVEEIGSAYDHLLEIGAEECDPIEDVGGGIKVGTVFDPFGNILGIIENPEFHTSNGTGR